LKWNRFGEISLLVGTMSSAPSTSSTHSDSESDWKFVCVGPKLGTEVLENNNIVLCAAGDPFGAVLFLSTSDRVSVLMGFHIIYV
jgi:hypothetical protein